MSDYIYYIDNNSISLADAAFETGDYSLSVKLYDKALVRLRKYRGDRMAPISLASSLVKKQAEAKKMLRSKRDASVLKFDTWQLSKTSYIKGLQCLKHLYLDKYKKKEKTKPSAETMELFKRGHDFEELFRRTVFPEGINVKNILGMNFAYFNSYTDYLFKKTGRQVIFEATIIENGVFIMADVIEKLDGDLYDFYEIKLYTELNEVIWNDLAIQYYVCKKRFGNKINNFNVVLRKNENDWTVTNLKKELEEKIKGIDTKIAEMKAVLQQNQEPETATGEHCQRPYECEFVAYCGKIN